MRKLYPRRSIWPKTLPLHPTQVHQGKAGLRWCLPCGGAGRTGGRWGVKMYKPKWISPLGPRNGHNELKALHMVCLKASQEFFVSFILILFENGRQPPPGRSRVAGTDMATEAGEWGHFSEMACWRVEVLQSLWLPKTKSETKKVIGPQSDLSQLHHSEKWNDLPKIAHSFNGWVSVFISLTSKFYKTSNTALYP